MSTQTEPTKIPGRVSDFKKYVRVGVNPTKLFVLAVSVIATFIIVHLIVHYLQYVTGDLAASQTLVPRLNMNSEVSLPTWFSQTLLLAVAALVALAGLIVSNIKGRLAYAWFLLSAIFVYLSIDEGASLHEPSTAIIQAQLLRFDVEVSRLQVWLVEGTLALTVFAVAFTKLWLSLPKKARLLSCVGVILYGLGAVGTDVVAQLLGLATGVEDFEYAIWVAVEEGLEMLGVSLVAYGLAGYVQILNKKRQLVVEVQ